MRIDLLQVNRMSFSAKGQGEESSGEQSAGIQHLWISFVGEADGAVKA